MLVAVSIWACGGVGGSKQEVADVLTGHEAWRWDVQAIRDSMNKLTLGQSEFDVIMASLKRMESGVFEFKKDGQLILTIMGEPREGTWALGSNGKTITMTLPNVAVVPNDIVEISADRFMLGADKPNGVLFPKIFVPMEPGSKMMPVDTSTQQQQQPADTMQ